MLATKRTERLENQQAIVRILALFGFRTFVFRHSTVLLLGVTSRCNYDFYGCHSHDGYSRRRSLMIEQGKFFFVISLLFSLNFDLKSKNI